MHHHQETDSPAFVVVVVTKDAARSELRASVSERFQDEERVLARWRGSDSSENRTEVLRLVELTVNGWLSSGASSVIRLQSGTHVRP